MAFCAHMWPESAKNGALALYMAVLFLKTTMAAHPHTHLPSYPPTQGAGLMNVDCGLRIVRNGNEGLMEGDSNAGEHG